MHVLAYTYLCCRTIATLWVIFIQTLHRSQFMCLTANRQTAIQGSQTDGLKWRQTGRETGRHCLGEGNTSVIYWLGSPLQKHNVTVWVQLLSHPTSLYGTFFHILPLFMTANWEIYTIYGLKAQTIQVGPWNMGADWLIKKENPIYASTFHIPRLVWYGWFNTKF